jgi:dihydroneopterin aldolase
MIGKYTLQWELYGFHGVYASESQIGTWFELECQFEIQYPEELNDQLEEVINYEDLHQLVIKVFNKRCQLIETVAQHLKQELSKAFPELQNLKLKLTKKLPVKHFKQVSFEC